MHRLAGLAPLPLAVFALTPAALAQKGLTETIPAAFATVEGNSATGFPFASTGGMRVMYAYDAEVFGLDQPVQIRGIAFRPDSSALSMGPATYGGLQIELSTGQNAAGNLARNFDANHGADRTVVRLGNLTIPSVALGGTPHDFVFQVPFSRTFTWNPGAGPLLVDMRSNGTAAGSNLISMDGTSTVSGVGRIVHRSDPNAVAADFPNAGTQRFGLIAQLDLNPRVAPDNLATAEGNSSSAYPWNQPAGSPMRVMYVYDSATFRTNRGRQRIHRLGFRPDGGRSFGGGSFDCKITLSTGAPTLSTAISSTFADNVGTDAKVVFDGVFTAPAVAGGLSPNGFDLEIPLTESFSFNPGEGSLVVDIEFRSSTLSSGVSFDGRNGSGVARVFNLTSSTAPTGTTQSFGLALAVAGYPEPTLPRGDDFVAGSSASSFPWSRNQPMRVQTAYLPGALEWNQRHQITHLRFRPNDGVGVVEAATFDCTIDLSTKFMASTAAMGLSFAANHGSRILRAFRGKVTLPRTERGVSRSPWALEIELDFPYLWNPSAGALIVDIRVLSSSGTNVSFDGSFDPNVVRVAHRSDPSATQADFAPQTFGLDISLGGEGCKGITENYGTGCAGPSGLIPTQSTHGLPSAGNTQFAWQLHDAEPNAVCAMLLGSTQLAADLTALGAPGCGLYTNRNIASFPVLANSGGDATVEVPLSYGSSIDGFVFFSTWAMIDPAANALGVYTTDGLRAEFCSVQRS